MSHSCLPEGRRDRFLGKSRNDVNIMTIQKLLTRIIKKLKDKSPSANLDAEVLLIDQISKIKNQKIDKTWLYSHEDYQLTKKQLKEFNKSVSRRLSGEPIAYITGHKEFYGLDFAVNKNVMVPRPETEILVEEAIKYTCPESLDLARDKYSRGVKKRSLKIVDIGTGSGCIAISIAKNCPNAKITVTDLSMQILAIAQKNARLYQVASKIQFVAGDLPIRKKYDVILANLPYLKSSQIKNDLLHEPRKALYGGPDGLREYRKFFNSIKKNLAKNYLIIIEFDPSQVAKLKRIIIKNLDAPRIKILKDLARKNRFLTINPSQPK